MPPDISKYILSPSESLHIFETQIVPAEFPTSSHHTPASTSSTTSTSTSKPLAILIVGQTGAGKSNLVSPILASLHSKPAPGSGHIAHFIADTYKTYHPSYVTLFQEHPALASPATGTDARRWLAMACEEAVSRKVPLVLVESACRHPEDFSQLARIFHGAGYTVRVIVLAVPAVLSRLGVLVRYVRGLPEAGPAKGLPVRLTPVKVHDDSYQGLVKAAKFLDDEPHIADKVFVVRRGNWLAYERGPKAQGGSIVGEAVGCERMRPLTDDEVQVFKQGEELLAPMPEYAAQLDAIRQMVPAVNGHVNSFPKLRSLDIHKDVLDP